MLEETDRPFVPWPFLPTHVKRVIHVGFELILSQFLCRFFVKIGFLARKKHGFVREIQEQNSRYDGFVSLPFYISVGSTARLDKPLTYVLLYYPTRIPVPFGTPLLEAVDAGADCP